MARTDMVIPRSEEGGLRKAVGVTEQTTSIPATHGAWKHMIEGSFTNQSSGMVEKVFNPHCARDKKKPASGDLTSGLYTTIDTLPSPNSRLYLP
jgi:hypothetical protein